MSPELHTERLTMRLPVEADYPACAAFFATERSALIGGPLGARFEP